MGIWNCESATRFAGCVSGELFDVSAGGEGDVAAAGSVLGGVQRGDLRGAEAGGAGRRLSPGEGHRKCRRGWGRRRAVPAV